MNALLGCIRAISSQSNLFKVGPLGFAYRQAAGDCQGLAVFVLGWAIAPVDSFGAKLEVFGFPTAHSLTPGPKSAWVQLRPHDLDN